MPFSRVCHQTSGLSFLVSMSATCSEVGNQRSGGRHGLSGEGCASLPKWRFDWCCASTMRLCLKLARSITKRFSLGALGVPSWWKWSNSDLLSVARWYSTCRPHSFSGTARPHIIPTRRPRKKEIPSNASPAAIVSAANVERQTRWLARLRQSTTPKLPVWPDRHLQSQMRIRLASWIVEAKEKEAHVLFLHLLQDQALVQVVEGGVDHLVRELQSSDQRPILPALCLSNAELQIGGSPVLLHLLPASLLLVGLSWVDSDLIHPSGAVGLLVDVDDLRRAAIVATDVLKLVVLPIINGESSRSRPCTAARRPGSKVSIRSST